MRHIDRTGQSVGKLTVLDDDGDSQLRCRCSCGREGMYPRAIFKPSYRGPKACPWCLGSPCEVCGQIIPRKGGIQSATCSKPCFRERNRRRERERYHQVKDTPEWREARERYLARLAEAMDEDPELREHVSARLREAARRWRQRQNADPVLRERLLARQRETAARAREQMLADPAAYARYLQKLRDWYHSLSDEEYQRIFVEPRNERRLTEALGTAADKEVAERFGLSADYVGSRRRALGIPSYRGR